MGSKGGLNIGEVLKLHLIIIIMNEFFYLRALWSFLSKWGLGSQNYCVFFFILCQVFFYLQSFFPDSDLILLVSLDSFT